MMEDAPMAALALWALLFVSVLRALEALVNRSWRTMWIAAVCSLVVSAVAGFGPGRYVVVLPFLQLAGAAALRVRAGPLGWLALLLAAGLVWIVGFPGQIWAWSWALWLIAFLLGSVALAIGAPARPRRAPAESGPSTRSPSACPRPGATSVPRVTPTRSPAPPAAP